MATDKLYPILPHQPSSESDNILMFRLQKINDIQTLLENNIKERVNLNRKYKKTSKIIDVAECVLASASIGMGGVGIGLLSTIIAAPVVLGLEIAALALGSSGVLLKIINKKIMKKAVKHNEIQILAESKLNTIYDLVSKAINDSKISNEEFSLILNEYKKLLIMKEKIRNSPKHQGSTFKKNHIKDKC
jgi:hypothetical protein